MSQMLTSFSDFSPLKNFELDDAGMSPVKATQNTKLSNVNNFKPASASSDSSDLDWWLGNGDSYITAGSSLSLDATGAKRAHAADFTSSSKIEEPKVKAPQIDDQHMTADEVHTAYARAGLLGTKEATEDEALAARLHQKPVLEDEEEEDEPDKNTDMILADDEDAPDEDIIRRRHRRHHHIRLRRGEREETKEEEKAEEREEEKNKERDPENEERAEENAKKAENKAPEMKDASDIKSTTQGDVEQTIRGDAAEVADSINGLRAAKRTVSTVSETANAAAESAKVAEALKAIRSAGVIGEEVVQTSRLVRFGAFVGVGVGLAVATTAVAFVGVAAAVAGAAAFVVYKATGSNEKTLDVAKRFFVNGIVPPEAREAFAAGHYRQAIDAEFGFSDLAKLAAKGYHGIKFALFHPKEAKEVLADVTQAADKLNNIALAAVGDASTTRHASLQTVSDTLTGENTGGAEALLVKAKDNKVLQQRIDIARKSGLFGKGSPFGSLFAQDGIESTPSPAPVPVKPEEEKTLPQSRAALKAAGALASPTGPRSPSHRPGYEPPSDG